MKKNTPLVSVCITTYNHERFIAACIEGALEQQVNFPYEIVIGEDKSKDGTLEVCQTFAKKYPDLIRLLPERENLGMKRNTERVIKACRGKYIAICDGDDFWTDPYKIQKQADFMEDHLDYSMTFSNIDVKLETSEGAPNYNRGVQEIKESRTYTDVEISSEWIVPSTSLFFRKEALGQEYFELVSKDCFLHQDTVMTLFLSSRGKMYGMKDYTGVYRRHEEGATNAGGGDIQLDWLLYWHLVEIIRTFGKHLKTNRIRKILSQLALSLALYNLSEKKYLSGARFLMKSIIFDKQSFMKYAKSKL